MKLYNHKENVTICTVNSDKFKTDYIGIHFITPIDIETASLNAVIPFILKRGTKKHPDISDINAYLDSLYGANLSIGVRKLGDNQVISMGLEFLSDKFCIQSGVKNECIEFLKELIFDPYTEGNAFSKDYTENEKKNLIDKIEGRINDKRTYSLTRLIEIMCENEPYGTDELGSIEKTKEIDNKAAYEQYKKIIANAGIVIMGMGRVTKEDCCVIADCFDQRSIGSLQSVIVNQVGKVRNVTEVFDVEQAKLSLGFRILNEDLNKKRGVISVLNCIYGGTTSSKLFENVRERLSLCYYCASRVDRFKNIMFVYSGIEADSKQKAQDEILLQLEDIKNGKFEDEKIDIAKAAIKNSYKALGDSIGAMEEYYLSQIISKDIVSLEDAYSLVQNVTRDEIVQMAKNIQLDCVYFLTSREAK